jgi:hypothetical protein
VLHKYYLNPSVFWVITRFTSYKTDVSGLPIGPTSRVSLTLKDGTDSPETSVTHHLTPRSNPEDGRIQFNRGRSLRSGECDHLHTVSAASAKGA